MTKEEAEIARCDEDEHRLTWVFLGPKYLEDFRRLASRKGEQFGLEWEVEPLVVGVMIMLAQDAQRKQRFGDRRQEYEVRLSFGSRMRLLLIHEIYRSRFLWQITLKLLRETTTKV